MGRTLSIVLAIALAGAVGYALGRSPGESAENHPAPDTHAQSPHDSLPAELPEDQGQEQPLGTHEEPADPPKGEALPGTVLEHIDVSQYTYLHLATEGGDTWAAVYRAPVKTGQKVTVQNAVKLEGFTSKELKRQFAVIYFGTLPGAEVAPPLDAGSARGTAL